MFCPQGFNQNDAALRFLQGQRALPQNGAGITASGVDVADLYGNAADLLSKAGMAGDLSACALSPACQLRLPPSVNSADLHSFGNLHALLSMPKSTSVRC